MSGTLFRGGINHGGADGTNKLGVGSRLVKKSVVLKGGTDTSETSTGFTLPDNAIVEDVMIYVHTVDATETVDVGTDGSGSNDPDGFLDGVSLATAGLVKGSLADGAITRGALLREETGTSTDVAYAGTKDITSGGDAITYTCSAGTDTAVFDIIVEFSVVEEL